MTPRVQRFIAEYLIDLNATQAALRAGYSPRSAGVIGHENLNKPEIAAAIAAAQNKRAEATGITTDRVLRELARIAFFDIRKLYGPDGRMLLPHELDDDTAAALVGIDTQETSMGGGDDMPVITTRKAKVIERTAALTLAMRHLGMLNDKLQVETIDRAGALQKARDRAKAA